MSVGASAGVGKTIVGSRQLSSQDVLREIRAQWTQAVAKGCSPTSRYGYVRREHMNELAVYGRGLEALDKPEYQSMVTSIQFNFVLVEDVLQDSASRLKHFDGLTALSFCRNQIHSPQQFESLKHLKCLRTLTITENPISELRGALRVQMLRLLPQLESLNGQQVDASERIAASTLFEPLDKMAELESPVCPSEDRPTRDSDQVVSMVDSLVGHAVFVDAKLQAVHETFENTVRRLLHEVWDELFSIEEMR